MIIFVTWKVIPNLQHWSDMVNGTDKSRTFFLPQRPKITKHDYGKKQKSPIPAVSFMWFFFFLFERERNIALILGEMSLKILTESKGSWLCPFLSSVPALPLPGTANSWVGGLSLYDCGCGFLSLHFEKHKLPHCRCCSTGGAGGSLTYFTAFADFCGYQNCL